MQQIYFNIIVCAMLNHKSIFHEIKVKFLINIKEIFELFTTVCKELGISFKYS